jgi:hypothetical protein
MSLTNEPTPFWLNPLVLSVFGCLLVLCCCVSRAIGCVRRGSLLSSAGATVALLGTGRQHSQGDSFDTASTVSLYSSRSRGSTDSRASPGFSLLGTARQQNRGSPFDAASTDSAASTVSTESPAASEPRKIACRRSSPHLSSVGEWARDGGHLNDRRPRCAAAGSGSSLPSDHGRNPQWSLEGGCASV